MPWREIKQLSNYTKFMLALGILLIACAIFSAGIVMGYHQAMFASGWEANYYQNMSGLQKVFAPFKHEDFLNSHGVIGSIVSFDMPNLIVRGKNQAEQNVLISTSTSIRKLRGSASLAELKPGQDIIVIGSPDDQGRINASFIRIVSSEFSSSSISSPRRPSTI